MRNLIFKILEKIIRKYTQKKAEYILINDIKDNNSTKIAHNFNSILYVDLYKLDVYKFLNFKIISNQFNININYKLDIIFTYSNNNVYSLKSDSTIIQTETIARNKNIHITKFDIDLDDKLSYLILNEEVLAISFYVKNQFIEEFCDIDNNQFKKLITGNDK
ncbi:MAG: hypothetical protein H6604_07345 [Flavobacteriales bacterium]|nr:hypothetical protein [Flavobacteriales bacterium]